MERAAGIAVICQGAMLLCHPTNSPWENSYSIPKGLLDDGEDDLSAAIRETREETGVDLSKFREKLEGGERLEIEYRRKNGAYKTVACFVLRISSPSDIGLEGWVVPKERLQTEEVDWVGFLGKEEAAKKIFWRLSDLIKFV